MKGRNGFTSFLPLKNKGGLNNKMISGKCLSEEQAKYVYDKIESGDELKVGMAVPQQSNSSLPKQVKEKKDINLYEKVLISNMNTIKNKSQMEQWSILSDNIVYVRSEGSNVMNGIDIKMVDYRDHRRMYRRMGKEQGERLNTDFGESPKVLRDKYMDVYEEVFAEVVTTNRFDENVDLSTTYLGKIGMRKEDIMKAEESFPISEQGFVMGGTLNGEECQILLDTGASKSYMSKSYYLRCKALHDLPKFALKTQRIQVGNGQYVGVLFVKPVIIEICGHRLEVFTLVWEIFDNVDMVLGIKN